MKSRISALALLALCAATDFATAQNLKPTLSITGERYLNRRTYLIEGTLTDDQPGAQMFYRIREKFHRVPVAANGTWRIQLRLTDQPARISFFAIDAQDARSDRQKRRITIQEPPTAQ